MRLTEQLRVQGQFFFRWRSFLPLFFLPLFLPAFREFHYPFGSHAWDWAWDCFCLGISLAGLGLRAAVAGTTPHGTSGRNQKHQRAVALNTSGLYSLMRNPLYLGNYLILLGVALFPHAWWLPLVTTLVFALFYERIICVEEEFLEQKFGDQFRAWAERTPMLLPQWGNYRPSDLPFCWRTALRREYVTLYEIVVGYFLLDTIADSVAENRFHFDLPWFCVFAGGTLFFATVRLLVKRTRLLHAEGR